MSIKMDLSENLSSYQEDLELDLKAIEFELNNIKIDLNTIPEIKLVKIKRLLQQSQNNVKQIEVELSLLPKSTREKYNLILKGYNEKMTSYSRQFNDLKISRNKGDKNNDEPESKQKLLSVTKTLNQGTNMMSETIRTLANVNSTDKDTMATVQKQTDSLKKTQEKLNEAEGFVDLTNKILRNMLRRVFTNKIVLFGLLVLLALINAFLIYNKLKHNVLGFKR